MGLSDTIYAGRTGLKRDLTYDRYIQSIQRALTAVVVVQIIPFLLVIITSAQSQSWSYLLAASGFLLVIVSCTRLINVKYLRALRGWKLRIQGDQIDGFIGQRPVHFSLHEIQSIELTKDPLQGKQCHLLFKNGETQTFRPGLERFDYVIDSIMGYRPEFRTPEIQQLRSEVLISDHLLAHLDSYTRKWLLIFFQFVALPVLLFLGLGSERFNQIPGITTTMVVAGIVITNLALGVYCCWAVTVSLARKSRKRLSSDPSNTLRDLRIESKLDYLAALGQTTVILIACLLAR